MMKPDRKAKHHRYGKQNVLESKTISYCSQLELDESLFIPISYLTPFTYEQIEGDCLDGGKHI